MAVSILSGAKTLSVSYWEAGATPKETYIYNTTDNFCVNHQHPTSTKTVELVVSAIRGRRFTDAAKIIEDVKLCSDRIFASCSEFHYADEAHLEKLVTKISEEDRDLHALLLKMYAKNLVREKKPELRPEDIPV